MRQLLPLVATAFLASSALAQALTGGFTYQGQLANAGVPVSTAQVDLRFLLFDAPTAGAQLGSTLCIDEYTTDSEGRITTTLDFGAQFNGQRRFLEVRIRAGGVAGDCAVNAGFITLTPRQELTVSPYAGYSIVSAIAGNATNLNGQPASFYTNAANLTGTLADARIPANVPRLNAVTSTYTGSVAASAFSGSGAALTNLNADNITTGTLAIARGGTGRGTIGANGGVAFVNAGALAYSPAGTAGQLLRSAGAAGVAWSSLVAADMPAPAGDVAGTYGAMNVVGLRGRSVGTAAPATGEVLTWNGINWSPAPLPLQAMGGDVTGNTSANTVVALRGRTVATTAPTDGQVLTYDAAQTRWEPATLPAETARSNESVRIVRAQIDAAAFVSLGSGCTVTSPAIGEYQITFSPAFASTPVVVANARDNASPQIITYSGLSSTGVTMYVWNTAGAAVSSDFAIVAIGP